MFELLSAAVIVVNGSLALPHTLHCLLSLLISLISGIFSTESQWAPQSPWGPTYHQLPRPLLLTQGWNEQSVLTIIAPDLDLSASFHPGGLSQHPL